MTDPLFFFLVIVHVSKNGKKHTCNHKKLVEKLG